MPFWLSALTLAYLLTLEWRYWRIWSEVDTANLRADNAKARAEKLAARVDALEQAGDAFVEDD